MCQHGHKATTHVDWRDWNDPSIVRPDGMDDQAMLAAVDAGARIVLFDTIASLATNVYVSRQRYLLLPGEAPRRVGLRATSLTALLGWWGLGFLQTPVSIYRNLSGGVDVTDEVRLELETRVAQQRDKAMAQAEVEASLTTELADRRARALTHLEHGEHEEAWALVGDATREGGPLARDLHLLLRLLTLLHDRRMWARADQVADTLCSEFPHELHGYTRVMVRRITVRANDPDGTAPPQPWWAIPVLILLGLGGVVATVIEIRKAWR